MLVALSLKDGLLIWLISIELLSHKAVVLDVVGDTDEDHAHESVAKVEDRCLETENFVDGEDHSKMYEEVNNRSVKEEFGYSRE